MRQTVTIKMKNGTQYHYKMVVECYREKPETSVDWDYVVLYRSKRGGEVKHSRFRCDLVESMLIDPIHMKIEASPISLGVRPMTMAPKPSEKAQPIWVFRELHADNIQEEFNKLVMLGYQIRHVFQVNQEQIIKYHVLAELM